MMRIDAATLLMRNEARMPHDMVGMSTRIYCVANRLTQFADSLSKNGNASWTGSTKGEPFGQSGSGGPGFFCLATSPPIGQALAASTLDCAAGALGIVNPELNAVRIAEIELG